MERIRLGIIGGGLITQVAHLPAARALDACFHVQALAEPSARVRAALAARYGIPHVAADHAALLASGDLDAVLVCSPNGTHAQLVLDALDAGLHVLVEKPLCVTARDGRAIVERARAARRVVQVGYMKRFDPAYERLLDELPAPRDLRLITTTTVDPAIGQRLRPAGFVAPDPVPGGDATLAAQVAEAIGSDDPAHVKPFSDAFLGALSHDVNLVLGALDAMGLSAGAVTDALGGADGTLAYGALDVGDGARWSAAWMLLPHGGRFREDLRIFAADGVRTLAFGAPYLGVPTELRTEAETARRWAPPANAYARALEHFHACITRGEPCRTPAEQAARDVALLSALYRTAVAA